MRNSKKTGLTVGVDIGGTKISIGLVGNSGGVIDGVETATGPDFIWTAVGEKIIAAIASLLEKNRLVVEDIQSVGVGIPGTTDSKTGIVGHAPNLGWNNVPLGGFLKKRLPSDLYFVQETHAAVLAEFLFGAGRGCRNLACVAIGTGIGCGLIINGSLHRGSFNTAGEFGHIMAVKNGRACACGNRGCIEAYGAGPSIRKIIAESNLSGLEGLEAKDLFDIALRGRDDVRKIIVDSIEYIGMGLINIVNLLSPEKILLTGGLSDQEELVVKVLQLFVKKNAYSLAAEKVIVERAALGKDAPMIGAAMLFKAVEPYSP